MSRKTDQRRNKKKTAAQQETNRRNLASVGRYVGMLVGERQVGACGNEKKVWTWVRRNWDIWRTGGTAVLLISCVFSVDTNGTTCAGQIVLHMLTISDITVT